MSRLALLSALVLIAAARAFATPGPGPGEPFGGDAAGCVPVSSQRLSCSLRMGQAFDKLEKGIVKCHARQAKARFSTVVLGQPEAFDEEACKTAATDRFDGIVSASAAGTCAGSPVLATASAGRTALVNALDLRNGDVYCDPTAAAPIDPGGDDTGFVSATDDQRRCADRVATNLRKLAKAVRCCPLTTTRSNSITVRETCARYGTASPTPSCR